MRLAGMTMGLFVRGRAPVTRVGGGMEMSGFIIPLGGGDEDVSGQEQGDLSDSWLRGL